jgi:ABC-2 type transport system permease protein
MAGAIFFETLRRKWRQVFYWGGGLIIWALYPFLLMPDQEGLKGYQDLIEGFDSTIIKAIGLDSGPSLATPEGFIGYAFFSYILLIMGVYAVISGLNVTANDEDSGRMDMLLSLPIPRWRIVVETVAGYMVMLIAICFLAFIGLLLGSAVTPVDVNIATIRFLEGALNIIPGTALMMAVTVFIGVLVQRRTTAAALAGGFVVVSYLLNSLANIADSSFVNALGKLSLFEYFDRATVLQSGLVWSDVLILLGAAIVFTVASVALFERRDIAV